MKTIRLQCCYCGTRFTRRLCQLLSRGGSPQYCDRKCSALGRRKGKSLREKRANKAQYDREYRAKNLSEIKRKKAEHFQRTYDPEKARIERKKNMQRHINYCRRPEYKRWKKEYDEAFRAKKLFGPFHESFLLLKKLENEIGKRMTDYEIRVQQGTLNKMQTRKKALLK